MTPVKLDTLWGSMYDINNVAYKMVLTASSIPFS